MDFLLTLILFIILLCILYFVYKLYKRDLKRGSDCCNEIDNGNTVIDKNTGLESYKKELIFRGTEDGVKAFINKLETDLSVSGDIHYYPCPCVDNIFIVTSENTNLYGEGPPPRSAGGGNPNALKNIKFNFGRQNSIKEYQTNLKDIRDICSGNDTVEQYEKNRKSQPLKKCIQELMDVKEASVKVAIIDSGINPSVFNSKKRKTVIAKDSESPCNSDSLVGYNFTDEGEPFNILDTIGHGTAVALSLDRSLEFNKYSGSKPIGIVPLKVIKTDFDDKGNKVAFAKMSDIVCALYFAAKLNVKYINISIGVLGHMIAMPLVRDVFKDLIHNHNITFITTSAGNDYARLGSSQKHVPSYYASKIKGVYEATGLDVDILTVNPTSNFDNAKYIPESNYYADTPPNNRTGVAAPALLKIGADDITGTSFASPWLLGALISGKNIVGPNRRSRINIDDVVGYDIE